MTQKQTVIGITMVMDEGEKMIPGVHYSYIRRDYGRALESIGAVPIYLDASTDPEAAAGLCDGIVISGGEDIHPSIYGQELRTKGLLEPVMRTHWERRLIDACDRRGIPILGICYGSQLLNVHYGGTLYQDIADETESVLNHGRSDAQAMHTVTFREDMLGYQIGHRMSVAARHHQAVKDLADGFEVVAHADDGVIEAIKGRGHFGIQWHPESDASAAQIYAAFVEYCSLDQETIFEQQLAIPEV